MMRPPDGKIAMAKSGIDTVGVDCVPRSSNRGSSHERDSEVRITKCRRKTRCSQIEGSWLDTAAWLHGTTRNSARTFGDLVHTWSQLPKLSSIVLSSNDVAFREWGG